MSLLSRMLLANPQERISADEALNHEYFQSVRAENDSKPSSPCLTKASERRGNLILIKWEVLIKFWYSISTYYLLFNIYLFTLNFSKSSNIYLVHQNCLIIQTKSIFYLLITWALKSFTSEYPTIWVTLTSTTPSIHSQDSTQVHPSKIETNISEILLDISS